MFCPKTGRKLSRKIIDGEALPCCEKTDCKNWGKLCHDWKYLAQVTGQCSGECDKNCTC